MATIASPAEARPFEHLVLDFLAYLEFERGLSRNTLEAYRSDLFQFGRYLESHGADAVSAKATDLYDESAESEENERIEIVKVPLAELDDAIRDCRDSKSLIGLLWLRAYGL